MATAGLDGMLKIWDLRTYKLLNRYITPTPVQSLSISQKGLLATAHGAHLTIWKDTFSQKQPAPYMAHMHPGSVLHDIKFCPYEDVLGYGHNSGVTSILVPGAGEPNFDALESNPFQTTKQRQEGEVRSLLDKIQPEMISLNPSNIGAVDRVHKEVLEEERRKEWEANNPGKAYDPFAVNKARGKSSSKNRYLKKQMNIIDRKREMMREKMRRTADEEKHASASAGDNDEDESGKHRSALDRFQKRTNINN
jgi:U3 small nucleolar RNA-associated protein 7